MNSNFKDIPILPILLGGGFIFFGYKTLQKLGILKDAQDRTNERLQSEVEDVTDESNFFSPTMKLPKGALLLTISGAGELAKKLYNKAHWYNDDEEGIYSIFRSLKTRSQVTSLSFAFFKLYQKDLYYWLKDVLNDKELSTVLKIVNSKPKYSLK